MPLARRARIRDEKEVVARTRALQSVVLAAAGERVEAATALSPLETELLARDPAAWAAQERTDALWRGEALGALAWALSLVEALPPYDAPFDHAGIARSLSFDEPSLRDPDELDRARESARLWHWRARTAQLQADASVTLPERWRSFDQLVAAAAMRGYEEGLLPPPLRGDFAAFGKVYRQLDADRRALAHSIAAERHLALAWLCGSGAWDETETDT